MELYFIIPFLLVIGWIREAKGKDVSLPIVYLLTFMMLMCGFRDTFVGTDTERYMEFATTTGGETRFGLFYEFLRDLGQRLGNSPSIYLMELAILTYIPLTYFVKRESLSPALTVLLYVIATPGFFLETFNISRQALSIIYCLGAMIFIEKKDYKLASFFSLLAVIFHQFNILFPLFIWINSVGISKRTVYVLLAFSMIIGLTGIAEYLNLFFMQLEFLSGFGASSEEFLAVFTNFSDREIMNDNNLTGQLSQILPVTALCVLSYTNKETLSFYYKCFFIGAVITNLFVTTEYGARLASSLTIGLIFAVPIAIKELSATKKYLLTFLIVLIGLMYVRNIFILNTYTIKETPVPYKCILYN
ncbi:MAG: EpsG family protein [Paludibacteraceae bacterium]|nr:EpsG family protein [Paludibacteraceae bacterium]